ncbi:MAG: hypothetical protein JWO92_1504 [Chitinophagaceae bacterium]|nr:hypothetical protein [Chitinophagaceae bacterium]
MEQRDLLSNDLQINPTTESHLTEIAKWGKFLAIMGFIFCGIMVIIAFAVGKNMERLSGYGAGYNAEVSTGVTIFYLLIAVLLFFPCLFLYKFSVKMQQSLKSVNQEVFEMSFQNLKAMFKFQGILAIIGLVIWVLALVVILGRGF